MEKRKKIKVECKICGKKFWEGAYDKCRGCRSDEYQELWEE